MGVRRAGIASFTIDGTSLDVAGDLKYSTTTIARETLTGQDKVHGFKEAPKPGFMSLKVRDGQGLTVSDYNAMTDVNCVAILANGKSVSGSGMWQVGDIEVDTQEGTFELRFEGEQVEES